MFRCELVQPKVYAELTKAMIPQGVGQGGGKKDRDMTEKASTPPVNSGWLRGRLNEIALAVGIVVALLGGMHLIAN